MLSADNLPEGFAYPQEFLRVVEQRLVNLEPWEILNAQEANDRHNGLKS